MNNIIIGWDRSRRVAYANSSWKEGHVYQEKIGGPRPVGYHADAHMITFAPTGAGKGVSCVIPTLLEYKGSVIVIDPKGENFAATSRFRKLELDQEIFAFDPYRVSHSWDSRPIADAVSTINPFDLIRDGRDSFGAQARVLADALIPTSTLKGDEKFWGAAAQNLLAGVISHVLESKKIAEQDRNISAVAEIIAGDVTGHVLDILAENEAQEEEGGVGQLSRFTSLAFRNFVNLGSADRARDSVIFTLNTYLENLLTDEIAGALRTTNINVDNLRKLSKPYSFYLILPPEKLQSDANVLRLMLTCVLRLIISRRRNPEVKELFLLDECAQLGGMNELRQVITLLRGYGVLAWMFFQDLSQLQTTYMDWKSIVNNCGLVQVFGYDRKDPAREISDLLGGVEASEIMKLGARRQVISIRGQRPRVIEKMDYRYDEFFKGRADVNPYHG